MKCKEVKYYLGDFLDGKLIDEFRREIDVHLSFCQSCKNTLEEMRTASRSSREKFAGDFWEGSTDMNEYDTDLKLPDILFSKYRGKADPVYKLKPRHRFLHSKWIAIGAPAVSIFLAIIIGVLYFSRTPVSFWKVDVIRGNPVVDNQPLSNGGALQNGKWLKTDAVSEAVLKSEIIGDIEVAPESELKLSAFNKGEYKLYLKSGKITAKTWSPPDFLKIEIPSGELIDLGCAFSLDVEPDNSTVINVSSGWVSLKTENGKMILPSGMVCKIDENGAVNIPYYNNSSPGFKDALLKYKYGNNNKKILQYILANARKTDEISLWYLLKISAPGEKKIIYDRLAELELPPDNVNFNGILNGDNFMLISWWEKLGCGSRTLWSY